MDAWNAQAVPALVILSQSESPVTSRELQSSEVSLVTTVTAMGVSCGDSSKQSFAQCRSPASSTSTPASYLLAKPTLTRAARLKSPGGGVPTSRPASGTWPPPAGSTNMSVPAAAVSTSASGSDLVADRRLTVGGERERERGNRQRGHAASMPASAIAATPLRG